jgi:hypothetical protein
MGSLAMGTQYTHQGEAIVPQTLILQDVNFIYMVHKEKGTIDIVRKTVGTRIWKLRDTWQP